MYAYTGCDSKLVFCRDSHSACRARHVGRGFRGWIGSWPEQIQISKLVDKVTSIDLPAPKKSSCCYKLSHQCHRLAHLAKSWTCRTGHWRTHDIDTQPASPICGTHYRDSLVVVLVLVGIPLRLLILVFLAPLAIHLFQIHLLLFLPLVLVVLVVPVFLVRLALP